MGTLLSYLYLPPYWLEPYLPLPTEAAQSSQQSTQQKVNLPINKPQESAELSSNYYQGVRISREDLKSYLKEVFTKYGLENQIGKAQRVIDCESSFLVDPPHNNSCRGIAQFQPLTWRYVINKGWCYGDIMNPFSQLDCFSKLWSMGYQSWWQCYGMVQ